MIHTLTVPLIASALASSILAIESAPPPTTAPAQSQPATSTAPAQSQPAREELVIAGERFRLEIAADDASREKGLMGRDHLDDLGGMLFIFPRPELLSFWMADCIIDIEVLFVDSKGRIVALHKMKAERPKRADESQDEYEARLKRYESRRLAQFAIELKSGTIDRLKLKPGQTIEMETSRLAKLAR